MDIRPLGSEIGQSKKVLNFFKSTKLGKGKESDNDNVECTL
jgi:hypothetical protein